MPTPRRSPLAEEVPSDHLARAGQSQAVGRELLRDTLEPVRQIAAAAVVRILEACSQTLAVAAAETDQIAAAGRVVADPDRPLEEQSQAEAAACRRSRLRGSQMSCGGQYGERASVKQIPHTCQERRWRRGLGHRESAILPRLRC